MPAYPTESFFRRNYNSSCSLSAVLEIDMNGLESAKFDFFYLFEDPEGYTFDIADARTSNGDGGDAGLTPWNTEVQESLKLCEKTFLVKISIFEGIFDFLTTISGMSF